MEFKLTCTILMTGDHVGGAELRKHVADAAPAPASMRPPLVGQRVAADARVQNNYPPAFFEHERERRERDRGSARKREK